MRLRAGVLAYRLPQSAKGRARSFSPPRSSAGPAPRPATARQTAVDPSNPAAAVNGAVDSTAPGTVHTTIDRCAYSTGKTDVVSDASHGWDGEARAPCVNEAVLESRQGHSFDRSALNTAALHAVAMDSVEQAHSHLPDHPLLSAPPALPARFAWLPDRHNCHSSLRRLAWDATIGCVARHKMPCSTGHMAM
jgi:hypothetical protein